MTEADMADFRRQLAGAVAGATRRGEKVVGYHWRDGHLGITTAPLQRERKVAAPPAPPTRRISRGIQGSLL